MVNIFPAVIESTNAQDYTLSGIITLAVAIIGAVLGVLNTWTSYTRNRLKISVEARGSILADGFGNTQHRLCVEVVNLSFIPVTISQICFTLHGDGKNVFHFRPEFLDGKGNLPRTLEARNSLTAFVPIDVHRDEALDQLNAPFIETACGKRFKGSGMAVHSAMKDALKSQRQ